MGEFDIRHALVNVQLVAILASGNIQLDQEFGYLTTN